MIHHIQTAPYLGECLVLSHVMARYRCTLHANQAGRSRAPSTWNGSRVSCPHLSEQLHCCATDDLASRPPSSTKFAHGVTPSWSKFRVDRLLAGPVRADPGTATRLIQRGGRAGAMPLRPSAASSGSQIRSPRQLGSLVATLAR